MKPHCQRACELGAVAVYSVDSAPHPYSLTLTCPHDLLGSAPVSSGAVAVYSVDSAPRATGCAISGATRPSSLAMSLVLSILARPCALMNIG